MRVHVHIPIQQELKPRLPSHPSLSGMRQNDVCKSCINTSMYMYLFSHDLCMVRKRRKRNVKPRKQKRSRGCCGECIGYQQPNCGTCAECVDMKCFGGRGVKTKACRTRKCTSLASITTTSAPNSALAATNMPVATTISKLSSLVHGSRKNVLFETKIHSTCMSYTYTHVHFIGRHHFKEHKPLSREGMLKVTHIHTYTRANT